MSHWGAWMVPDLSPAEDLKLRAIELDLARSVHQAPELVAALAGQLTRQNAQMQSIIRQAAGRMCELEARLALLEDPDDSLAGWLEMAREMRRDQVDGHNFGHEIGHDKT